LKKKGIINQMPAPRQKLKIKRKRQKITFEEMLSYCIVNRDKIQVQVLREDKSDWDIISLRELSFDNVLEMIHQWLALQIFPSQVDKISKGKNKNV
jgi:hypothetical protein